MTTHACLFLAALLMTGVSACIDAPADANATMAPPSAVDVGTSAPAPPAKTLPPPTAPPPRSLLAWRDGDTTEFDVLCKLGGGMQLMREDHGRVWNGTDRIEFRLEFRGATVYTGVRVGYVVDSNNESDVLHNNKTITWLPATFQSHTHIVAVAPHQWETGAEEVMRWAFYYEVNPGREDLCYTGVGKGDLLIRIEAVVDG